RVVVVKLSNVEVQRKFIANDRAAEVGLDVAGLRIWFCGEKRIARVQGRVTEIKVQIAVIVAGSRLRNDLRAAIADSTELASERIVTDADFLNLVLRRNAAARESVDNE